MIKVEMTKEINNSTPIKINLLFKTIEEYALWARNYHYTSIIDIKIKKIEN